MANHAKEKKKKKKEPIELEPSNQSTYHHSLNALPMVGRQKQNEQKQGSSPEANRQLV